MKEFLGAFETKKKQQQQQQQRCQRELQVKNKSHRESILSRYWHRNDDILKRHVEHENKLNEEKEKKRNKTSGVIN